MCFSAIGTYQLLSQMYTFKEHRIACSFKVLPTPVPQLDREPRNDFHWMDAARWSAIERALWRQLENLDNWKDAKRLRVNLMIDHMNVWIRATEELHPAMEAEDDLADLSLSIKLQYITSEDIVITDAEAKNTTKSSSFKVKPFRIMLKKLPQSKPKHKQDGDDSDDEDWLPPIKIKRELESQVKNRSRTRSIVESKTFIGGEMSEERPSTSVLCKALKLQDQPGVSKQQSGELKDLPGSLKDQPEALKQQFGGSLKRKQTNEICFDKPPKIQILVLENMNQADVLATFDRYKSHFDAFLLEQEPNKGSRGYMNVSHLDIMNVLKKDIRDEMIKMLSENYCRHSNHASLVVNGLLPLWIVLLFADTFKLSHGDAVRQIKSQRNWSFYWMASDGDPLDFDLDGS
ncbi:hypothetical protein KR054_001986 [Drosophila jambulina]|nr:hypothetical protein KR054_001986 [Drosophila jambulina]